LVWDLICRISGPVPLRECQESSTCTFMSVKSSRYLHMLNLELISWYESEWCFSCVDGNLVLLCGFFRWEYFVCHLLELSLFTIILGWQFSVSYFLALCTSSHMIGSLTCLLNLPTSSILQKVSIFSYSCNMSVYFEDMLR